MAFVWYLQVCPICESRVDLDMVGHITMEHGNLFKISFFAHGLCFVNSISFISAMV